MSDLRSASLTGIITLTDKGRFALGFTRSVSAARRIRQTEEMGIGDHRTRAVVMHAINFSGNLNRCMLINETLTSIGFAPADETWFTFNAPSLFFPDLVDGKMSLAIYQLYIQNQNFTIAVQQTLQEQISFLSLNVLDRYELGL